VTLAQLGITNCYYIAANGSDSNDGASEASGHPWLHAPGMTGASGSAAAHTPAAGDGYIFRGGDTWNQSNFTWQFPYSGTAANPIYIGVDQGWYSGGSWMRPIFDLGLTASWGVPHAYAFLGNNYLIIDNIEGKGLYETASFHPNFFGVGVYSRYENLYFHGWGHDSTFITWINGGAGCANNSGPGSCQSSIQMMTAPQYFNGGAQTKQGTVARYNVVDGSDTDKYQALAFGHPSSPPTLYGNVVRYVTVGVSGTFDVAHDNLFEYYSDCGGNGCGHQDDLYQQCGTGFTNTMLIYNNVIRHHSVPWEGGAVKLWLSGNCGNAGRTGYAFNNLLYDNWPGNIVDIGSHYGNTDYGTWNFFNNTIACQLDSGTGVGCMLGDNLLWAGVTGSSLTLNLMNNHWIGQSGSPLSCGTKPGNHYTCTEQNDLEQTIAQANSQGYSSTSRYAFQPTSTSHAGISTQSLCNIIGGVDSLAGAACQNDFTYACNYDAVNHVVVCPAKVTAVRGTVPNIGAYQFNGTQASTLEPPLGLTAVIQ